MNGNAQLIKLILETNVALFKFRDKKNKTAMTYACELGDIESIKAFLDFSSGKIKVNTGQGVERMTPLMYAASQGNYELAEFLLERKARVLSKDKFKRTALIMAVRNGHTRLASLLLQHGSEWNHADSSYNTPLHYAAGSGFIECIDLLIKHGADVNAQNSWKVTPITISMLNNHLGTVKRLLQEPTVDVNGKDDKGRTLLIMNMIDLSEPSCVNFAKYLLEKGADPNIADVDGNTALHRLAAYKVRVQDERFKKAETQERKSLLSMIDLLITSRAKLDILNVDGKNAFTIALDTDNIDVLHKFAESVRIS
jgi:ankyrin repeat protein